MAVCGWPRLKIPEAVEAPSITQCDRGKNSHIFTVIAYLAGGKNSLLQNKGKSISLKLQFKKI